MDDHFTLKLADFGFAKVIESAKLMYTQCGTPGYMAPEMFEHSGYNAMKADVWACGVILFIMFAGFPPFQSPKTTDWWFHKLKNNRHDLFWRAHCRSVHFSEGFKDLVNKILCPDPSTRISLDDIQRHEWYNGDRMNEQALFAEMQTRKAQVKEKKARERMTKMAKEQEGVVGMNIDGLYRALGDDFPEMPPSMEFYSQAKGRGAAAGMEFGGMGSAGEEGGTAHVYSADRATTIYTHFVSPCAAHELYGRLLVLIKSSCAEYSSKPSSYKIKGTTLSDSGSLKFVAQVFRDAGSARHHVEFKRLSGDGLQFRAMYYMLRDQMADMIAEDKSTEECKRE